MQNELTFYKEKLMLKLSTVNQNRRTMRFANLKVIKRVTLICFPYLEK